VRNSPTGLFLDGSLGSARPGTFPFAQHISALLSDRLPVTALQSMEVKLVDVPDAGYLSTNKTPQGEIYCRGPSLFKGYFKVRVILRCGKRAARSDFCHSALPQRPDLDDEAFAEGGWFKTGDVAQFNADGTMSIIDRIKNLVKLAGGEYIALGTYPLSLIYFGFELADDTLDSCRET
jgi:acyl-CoA synthetase (AMP-forming)/AMP-acid ligase II